jgi:hypothetical protein
MARNNNIQTLYVSVHLGDAPSFEVRAAEDPTATPTDCGFSGYGTGPGDRDFLVEIVQKIASAYGNSPALSLCMGGPQIKPDSECP